MRMEDDDMGMGQISKALKSMKSVINESETKAKNLEGLEDASSKESDGKGKEITHIRVSVEQIEQTLENDEKDRATVEKL